MSPNMILSRMVYTGCRGSPLILDKRITEVPLIRAKEASMAKKLYVGNLSYNTYEENLRTLFAQFGTVESVKIITDRDTGNSKGFAFVEMSTDQEAQAAIAGTNSAELDGRIIKVNEAMDKPRRDSRW